LHYTSVSKPGSKLYKTEHVSLRWGRIWYIQDRAFLDAKTEVICNFSKQKAH